MQCKLESHNSTLNPSTKDGSQFIGPTSNCYHKIIYCYIWYGSHLITFNSDQHSSQIDFILTRREERPNCMDCKVIPGECVITQHKLLMADFCFQVRAWRDKDTKITRMKWWKLKGDASQVFKDKVITKEPWNTGEDVDSMWNETSTHI
jgi:hypothetical protein